MFPESDSLQYVRGVVLDKTQGGMDYFAHSSRQLLMEVVPDASGYLLSCRSNVHDPQFVAQYSEAIRHISAAWLQSRKGVPGDLVVETMVDPVDQSQSLIAQSMKFGIEENSLPGLSDSVETFLSPRWPRAVSTMVMLGSGSNPVKLWSEGPKATSIEDKIGLEGPMDFFPTDAYARVLQLAAVDFRSQSLGSVSSFLERVRKNHHFGR